MNLNSFKRNRKALTALLICTGFITTHPLAAFAGDNVPAVQMVQQQKQSVSGIVKTPRVNRLSVPTSVKKKIPVMVRLPILTVISVLMWPPVLHWRFLLLAIN